MSDNNPSDGSNTNTHPINLIPIPFRDEKGPVFAEPWQAEVFAITVSLHEKGLFSWQQWADALNESITQAQEDGDPDLGDTYYHHWLDALERIVEQTNPGASEQLAILYGQWDQAARKTPHGQPIQL